MQALIFIAGAAMLSTALALPFEGPIPVTPPDSEFSTFENVTSPTCTANTTDRNIYGNRNGILDPRYRWSKFYVHLDSRYTQAEVNAVNNAMYNLKQVIPCVEFAIWPQNSHPTGDYIRITKGRGCSSVVGRQGGQQPMTLQSPECLRNGIIEHEMMHALGILHEHQRSDRDDHINIYLENVLPGHNVDFEKAPGYQYSTYNIPYNVRSIMHYASNAHSKNYKPTMLAKNGQEIGPTGKLQQTDIQKLQAIYRCK